MKHKLLSIALALVVTLAMFAAAQAIIQFYKLVVGTGTVVYADEVRVASTAILGNNRFRAGLQPTVNTVADATYTATLYFDGVSQGIQAVIWTQTQIMQAQLR